MSRANRVLLAAFAGILVLAVAAALLARARAVPPPPAGSPEAAVQSYVDAALTGRVAQAAEWLDPRDGCDEDDVRRQTEGGAPGARVVLVDTAVAGSAATVEVDLVYSGGGLLGATESTERQTYRLAQVDGRWLLRGTPWPLYDCWQEWR